METNINNIRFVEVVIIPRPEEKYYQLFENGIAKNCIFSESHLKSCLSILGVINSDYNFIMSNERTDTNKG